MKIIEAAIEAYFREIDTEPPPPGSRALAKMAVETAGPLLFAGWGRELTGARVVAVAEDAYASSTTSVSGILEMAAAAVAEGEGPADEAKEAVAAAYRRAIGTAPPAPGITKLAAVTVDSAVPMFREKWEHALLSKRAVKAGEAALASELARPRLTSVMRAVAAAVDEGEGG